MHTLGTSCNAWLVLTGGRTTYDAGTLQRLADFVDPLTYYYPGPARDPWASQLQDNVNVPANYGEPLDFGTFGSDVPTIPAELSDVVKWAPGAPNCFGTLEITNTSQSTVEIAGIEAKLAVDATPNTFSYQLLDVCTVANQQCTERGGVGVPCFYWASVQLLGGHAGTQVVAPLQAKPAEPGGTVADCPVPLILAPTKAIRIFLKFSSAPQYFVYTVSLGLQLGAGSLTTILDVPEGLNQHLVFVDRSSAFSCYGLQGTQFAIETQPPSQGGPLQFCR